MSHEEEMYMALRRCDVEMVAELIEQHDNINWSKRYYGDNLFFWTITTDCAEIVGLVLPQVISHGIDLLTSRNSGPYPLLQIAVFEYPKTVELLLEAGCQFESPFFQAAYEGNKAFLESCPLEELSQRDIIGVPLAHYASAGGQLAVLDYLLSKGISFSDRCREGNTVLLRAALNGHLAVVRWIVEEPNLAPDEKDSKGNTPLLLAASKGYLAVVRWLVEEQRLAPNKKNNEGSTALMLAAQNGHLDIVQWLVEEQQVDPNGRNNEGHTALLLATFTGQTDTMWWLAGKLHVAPDEYVIKSRSIVIRQKGTGVERYPSLTVLLLSPITGIEPNTYMHLVSLLPREVTVIEWDPSGCVDSSTISEQAQQCVVDTVNFDCDLYNLVVIGYSYGGYLVPPVCHLLREKEAVNIALVMVVDTDWRKIPSFRQQKSLAAFNQTIIMIEQWLEDYVKKFFGEGGHYNPDILCHIHSILSQEQSRLSVNPDLLLEKLSQYQKQRTEDVHSIYLSLSYAEQYAVLHVCDNSTPLFHRAMTGLDLIEKFVSTVRIIVKDIKAISQDVSYDKFALLDCPLLHIASTAEGGSASEEIIEIDDGSGSSSQAKPLSSNTLPLYSKNYANVKVDTPHLGLMSSPRVLQKLSDWITMRSLINRNPEMAFSVSSIKHSSVVRDAKINPPSFFKPPNSGESAQDPRDPEAPPPPAPPL